MKYVSWVEKNRPSKLNEICYQEDVKEGLRNFINNKNIPHLLFFGPSGSGKTSTILSLAKEIFGDHYRERIKELNASDERGITLYAIRRSDGTCAIRPSVSVNNLELKLLLKPRALRL